MPMPICQTAAHSPGVPASFACASQIAVLAGTAVTQLSQLVQPGVQPAE